MLTDAGSTPARSTNFTLYMRLTKYQKARLLEYEWDVVNHQDSDDNTFWVQIDSSDGDVMNRIKKLLDLTKNVDSIKLLVVATCTENK